MLIRTVSVRSREVIARKTSTPAGCHYQIQIFVYPTFIARWDNRGRAVFEDDCRSRNPRARSKLFSVVERRRPKTSVEPHGLLLQRRRCEPGARASSLGSCRRFRCPDRQADPEADDFKRPARMRITVCLFMLSPETAGEVGGEGDGKLIGLTSVADFEVPLSDRGFLSEAFPAELGMAGLFQARKLAAEPP